MLTSDRATVPNIVAPTFRSPRSGLRPVRSYDQLRTFLTSNAKSFSQLGATSTSHVQLVAWRPGRLIQGPVSQGVPCRRQLASPNASTSSCCRTSTNQSLAVGGTTILLQLEQWEAESISNSPPRLCKAFRTNNQC